MPHLSKGGLFAAASAVALLSGTGALAQSAPAAENIQEIVVTGSRLQTGFSAPTPLTVVGADQLQSRAPAVIGEVLAEVPAFRPNGGGTQGTGGTFGPGQTVLDLRGLGTTRTLVLVDGRRHVPNQTNGTFDTNVVPTALIERTEVVTGGASAAYGSDAVAGVVNIILRDRLQGVVGNAQYGWAEAGDNFETSLNLAAGTSFAGGRGHVIVGGDFSHAEPAGNIYTREWGKRETSLLQLTAARPAGLPANIIADNVELTFAPGSLVVGCLQGGVLRNGAACPFNNTTFNDAGQPVPFVIGSNLVGSNQAMGPGSNYGYSLFRNQYIRVGGERYAALARVNFDVTPDLTVFAELSSGRFQVDSRSLDYTTNANNIIINRDNPFLPAAMAQRMDAAGVTQLRMNRLNYANRDGVDVDNRNKFWQGVVGARGNVFGDWKWDVSYIHGVGNLTYSIGALTHLPNYFAAMYAVAGPGGTPICGPIATNPMLAALSPQTARDPSLVSPGCVPINPFGPANISQAAFDYANPRVEQFTEYVRDSGAVNLAGQPFSTWAGPVAVAIGGEWRKDSVLVEVSPLIQAVAKASAFFAANPTGGSGRQSVKEGYAEIGVPLAQDAGFARALDFNAAIRHTDYSTSGGVTTWKLGLTWEPTDFLRLRGTRSRDIRAPNIPELFIKGNDGFASRTNPKNGITATLSGANVNNPNLQPEIADTWTVGAVFQPTGGLGSGFRASIDYYRISIEDVIASLPAVDILNRYYLQNQTEYARFITFDPSPIGFSRVDSPLLNLNSQKVSGIDIELAYRVPTDDLGIPGRIDLSALGAWLERHETFDNAGLSLGDIAGAIPKWRWTVSVGYEIGKLNTNLRARYNSTMKYRTTLIGPDDPAYNPASPTSISDNEFPAMVYFSLSAQYELLARGSARIRAFGVVDNLLDKDPPRGSWPMLSGQGLGGSGGYNPYDAVGRSFKVGLRFQY